MADFLILRVTADPNARAMGVMPPGAPDAPPRARVEVLGIREGLKADEAEKALEGVPAPANDARLVVVRWDNREEFEAVAQVNAVEEKQAIALPVQPGA